jgi:hypothetical protein
VKEGIDDDGIMRLLNGPQMRNHLERVGFMVLARAVPKTGIDSGLLRNSMDSDVVRTSKGLERHRPLEFRLNSLFSMLEIDRACGIIRSL